jgi:hypothetical protein
VPAFQHPAKVIAVNQDSEQGAWMADVAPVTGPVTAARVACDRIAPIHDLLEEPFEGHAKRTGLDLIAVRPGERILEIGPGTGHCLAHRLPLRDGAFDAIFTSFFFELVATRPARVSGRDRRGMLTACPWHGGRDRRCERMTVRWRWPVRSSCGPLRSAPARTARLQAVPGRRGCRTRAGWVSYISAGKGVSAAPQISVS